MGIESKERWDEAGKGKKHERWGEKERNGEGQSENKLRAGAKWTGCRSTLRALYQVNLHSPLPLLLFQSVTGGSVTNTFFHPSLPPSLPRAPSPSSILPLTFLSPLRPPIPSVSLHFSSSPSPIPLSSLPSIGPSVSSTASVSLSLP